MIGFKLTEIDRANPSQSSLTGCGESSPGFHPSARLAATTQVSGGAPPHILRAHPDAAQRPPWPNGHIRMALHARHSPSVTAARCGTRSPGTPQWWSGGPFGGLRQPPGGHTGQGGPWGAYYGQRERFGPLSTKNVDQRKTLPKKRGRVAGGSGGLRGRSGTWARRFSYGQTRFFSYSTSSKTQCPPR